MIKLLLTYYKISTNELEWYAWCLTMFLSVVIGVWTITGMSNAINNKPKWTVADPDKVYAVQNQKMYERRMEMYGQNR